MTLTQYVSDLCSRYGEKDTLEVFFLHSSFDLLKKYAKTLTFKEVLSYSWGTINQSKSVFV